MGSPPPVGYSKATLLARGEVLKSALEALLDPALRREYDDAMAAGAPPPEEVPASHVAGVLALLQEAGDCGTVVAAGEEWLSTHRGDRGAADVALATALAHADAAAALVDSRGSTLQAVSMLEVAARLLAQYGVRGSVAAEVDRAIAVRA